MPPKLAAIIPALDHHPITRRCVESLIAAAQGQPARIVIVDDGSAVPYAMPDIPGVQCLRNEAGLGYTRATNRGIEFALSQDRPEAILLLNNDIELRGRAIARLSEAITDFALAGTFARSVAMRGGQDTHFLEFSCVLIRTEVFESIGLLDPLFEQGYYSDDDFCLRAQLAGFRLGQIPHANPPDILHYLSSTHGAARWQRMEEAFDAFLGKWGANNDPTVQRYIRERLWNPRTGSFGKMSEVEEQRRLEAQSRGDALQ
jgi:GT2 family glycosyltransferase